MSAGVLLSELGRGARRLATGGGAVLAVTGAGALVVVGEHTVTTEEVGCDGCGGNPTDARKVGGQEPCVKRESRREQSKSECGVWAEW